MSVTQDPRTGLWRVDVRVTRPDGTRPRKKKGGFRTETQAERYERRLRAELEAGTYQRQEPKRLREFAEQWYDHKKTRGCAGTTLATYRSRLDAQILPALGHMRLGEIRADAIERAIGTWFETQTARTVNHCIHQLLAILRTAHRWDLISGVPSVELLEEDEDDWDWFDVDEARALLAAASEAHRVMLLVGMRTGLRAGELRALQWDCVHLKGPKPTLDVRRNYSGRELRDTTKTKRKRTLPLPEDAVEALRSHPRRLDVPFVFVRPDGKPLSYDDVRDAIVEACEAAGLRRCTPHVMRHTYASQLVNAGVDLYRVATLCGHTSIATTQKYAHLKRDVLHDEVAKLERL